MNSIDRVCVCINGRNVGTLTTSPVRTLAFSYDAEWLVDGYSISPLSLPLREGVFIAKRDPLNGMFGVFDDSMPDGWGRLLTDRLLRQQGIDPYKISNLDRLSIVGTSGMGALEYKPYTKLDQDTYDAANLDRIAAECARLLDTDFSDDLDQLFALGGSSGGARPKILTTIDNEEWIIKFPSSVDQPTIGEDEYRISNIARECGIDMPETRLFPSRHCAGYFGIRRFDRTRSANGHVTKVHMISAGGLLETSHRLANLDYGLLMRLTMRICNSTDECRRLYRLMCFNVFIGNRDDHAKNFSYLYDPVQRIWKLSPAYDLTSNPGMNGEHTTTINGKGKGITDTDLLGIGIKAGIPQSECARIIMDIRDRLLDKGFSIQN